MSNPYHDLQDARAELKRLERMVIAQRVKTQALEIACYDWVAEPLPLGQGPLEPAQLEGAAEAYVKGPFSFAPKTVAIT